MSAIDIFEKLKGMAAGWSWRVRNRRKKKDEGVPGELVTSLTPDERDQLKNLKADDISEKKVPHGELWYFTDEPEEERVASITREEKLKFDKKIIKDDNGPRHRKYDR